MRRLIDDLRNVHPRSQGQGQRSRSKRITSAIVFQGAVLQMWQEVSSMRRLIDELRNETRDLREQLAKKQQDETAIKMVSKKLQLL